MKKGRIAFAGFGEVNTPREVIEKKCAQALSRLKRIYDDIIDTAPVSDDPQYIDADRAVAELSAQPFDVLVVCIAGWIPTHAVIRVIEKFKEKPMVIWALSGYYENGKLISTADQAGATALRYTMQALKFKFKYFYNVIAKEPPIDAITSFIDSALGAASLKGSRIGSMGYRDMQLYGTMFDGVTLKDKLGLEVEFFEMLEIAKAAQKVPEHEAQAMVDHVRDTFTFTSDCEDSILIKSAKYAIVLSEKIKDRNYEALTLIDVDGMKKLLSLPPAMIFMMIDMDSYVSLLPENDIMGSATQLMVRAATGQIGQYAEFYEFFEDGFLAGVPDFIQLEATEGQPVLHPSAFGMLSTSVVCNSHYKTGKVTMARLINYDGRYFMHLLSGEALPPPNWEECGWEPPAPKLPSLRIRIDCNMEDFASKVASQHIILAYGDCTEDIKNLCYILDIEVI